MDTKLKFLMMITMLSISYVVCEDETCPTYHCDDNLEYGVCSVKNGTDFTLQACKGDDTLQLASVLTLSPFAFAGIVVDEF